ncbi:MAG: ABC transporter permease subunit [Balneola sp.]|nr:ABC transporter permease subunit [Balneola sp.]MBO6652044.1 ABC transporter permease subunit [Balneola sp.]MBO6711041.1 ABC transporter permease subunit [Balneola sp.]MBO6800845.1 ABC transporter permease subunit [Balneola sp.]MBO6868976.1 ABC transporter permease subunit [Balneola sp.]
MNIRYPIWNDQCSNIRFSIFRLFLVIIVFVIGTSFSIAQPIVKIGSKLFTESVILGDITSQIFEANGINTEYNEQLGGTRILWNALLAEEIDVYPDYTGTIIQEILQENEIDSFEELEFSLNNFGVGITKPLGFNNTYALGMNKEKAQELNLNSISDLRSVPELRYGFSNEFLDRNDGWKGLSEFYGIEAENVTGLDHDLAYRGLEVENIDVIDLYSTDAEIEYYDLKVLKDDQNFFPTYQAVLLYRLELEKTNPEAITLLGKLESAIPEQTMIAMNSAVKLDKRTDEEVASEFLKENLQLNSTIERNTLWDRLLVNTLGHLYLVGISLGLAILIAIPLGVTAAKIKAVEGSIIGFVGILQTIPSLALLVFMIPLLGIGSVPAMAALFLYSLLPIVRNTHSGIKGISEPVMESAYALGLPNAVILKKIELPLALPTILAGIKTSAVINVGTATLGALIGAGGYGQPILTGIRLDSTALILEGAIPAALLALLVQGFFDLIEKWATK